MPVFALPSFAKGEISPNIYGRVDKALYRAALRRARNALIHSYGGVSNRPGSLCVGPFKSHDPALFPRIFRFHQGTTDQYVLEFGNLYMRVVRNDSYVLETATTITGATAANPVVVTAVAHGLSNGDDVYIIMAAGMVELNFRRFFVRNVTTDTMELEDQITGVAVDGTGYTAYTTGGTVAELFEVTTPYLQADLSTLKMVQTGNTITITHTGYAPRDLTRSDHNNWTFAINTYAPTITAPTNFTGTASFDDNFQVFEKLNQTVAYRVTAISDVDGRFEESLPATFTFSNSSDPPLNTLTWTTVAAADRYAVYRRDNGLYGLVGETELLTFEDKNLATDLSISPPSARNPFSSLFPMASGYYQQRQVYGGTTAEPDKSWYTQTGLRLNLSVSSPLQPADAITASLASQDVQEIRHYVPVSRDLLIFTNAGEWRVNSGPDSGFSADTIKQDPETRWGASHRPPIVFGKTVLFVEDGDARVRSIGYKFSIDGFDTNDLTILANHFLAEKSANEYIIDDWTFGQFPEPRVYMVRSDGIALTMTFDAEQEVIAWTSWDTDGLYKTTTSLRRSVDTVEDGIYFGVQRKNALGGDMSMLERMHSRKFSDVRNAFFLDMGHKIDNAITITDITDADPAVFTSVAHGLANGDEIELNDIQWVDEDATQFNDLRFTIANITADTFQLLDFTTPGDGQAWDLPSAKYEVTFSVSAEFSAPTAFMMNSDGSKMFVADTTVIKRYTLSTPYDVSTASYDGSGSDYSPIGGIDDIFLGNSGNTLFVYVGGVSRRVRGFALSSTDDVSTATLNADEWVPPHVTGGITFNDVGTKIYFIQSPGTEKIYEYTITAWTFADAPVRTATLTIGPESTQPRSLIWKTDGTKLYVIDKGFDYVAQYSATTAFDLSTTTYDAVTFSTISEGNDPETIFWKPDDGTVFYVLDGTDKDVNQYTSDAQSVSVDIGLPSAEVYRRGGDARVAFSVLTDLWCLEGLEVSLFLDGSVEPNQTVVNGKVTVADSRTVTRAFAGLPYTCDIELLDIEAEKMPLTLQGKLKKITDVTVRFYKSRMPQIGPRVDRLVQMRPREFEKLGQASALISGDARVNLKPEWNSNGRIFFRQSDPVPLTILAVFPDVTLEDDLE